MDAVTLLEQLARHEARDNFYAFRQYINPKMKKGWFQRAVCRRLQQFYEEWRAGTRPKLIIEAPPQHGKSEMIIDFCAWVAGKHPECREIYASFSDRLGIRANLKVRRIIRSERYGNVFPRLEIGGKDTLLNLDIIEFRGNIGAFRNTTVKGSITGESLDLGIIDDPMKGREQANSEVQREHAWEWFTDDFFTRFSDEAGMLSILTRWHVDDPIGRMLKKNPGIPVLKFPAIATKDEEFRKSGEPLFPEHKSLEFLLERKAMLGSSSWESLYQQNPMLPEGNLIKLVWFKRYATPPVKFKRIVQSWDTANKAGELNDHSVCTTWGETDEGYYLLEVYRFRLEFPALKRMARSLYEKWMPVAVLIEDKGSGTQLLQDLRTETKIPCIAIMPEGDKVIRASNASPIIEAGRVYLPESAPWLSDYESEILSFPETAGSPDQVDSTSQYLNWAQKNQMGDGPRIRRL